MGFHGTLQQNNVGHESLDPVVLIGPADLAETDSRTAHPDATDDAAGQSRRRISVRQREDLRKRFQVEVLPLMGALSRAARRYTSSKADAEDLLQETMIRAYNGFQGFKEGTNLRAWLFRILKNTWISTHRRRQTRPDEVLVAEFTESTSSRAAAAHVSAETEVLTLVGDSRLRAALATVSETTRQMMYYADVAGYRNREIAEIMGVPIGTVMSRLHRGRRRVKDLLTKKSSASLHD